MNPRHFFHLSLGFFALGLATVAAQPAAAASSCVFDTYRPTSVAPYNAEENVGYGSYTTLKGAQLYVAAQPGLTREWLELNMQSAVASGHACQLSVKPVQVAVTSAGSGFWVQFIGRDSNQANTLVHWARKVLQHER